MSAHTHEIATPAPPQLQEVSDGIYAYIQPDGSWWINNTGFVVGPQGVIARRRVLHRAAHAGVPRRHRLGERRAGAHAGQHPPPRRPHVRQRPVRRRRRSSRTSAPAPRSSPSDPPARCRSGTTSSGATLPLEPPFLTFTDRVTLRVGDLRAEVVHVGTPAHTTNDSIVWFPERSDAVLRRPALQRRHPVPAHGFGRGRDRGAGVRAAPARRRRRSCPGTARCSTTALDRRDPRLPALRAGRRRARPRGGPFPLDAARDTDLGPYADWPDAERIVGNLHRAYAELGGLERGGAIDVFAALGDMVAYNGGRPLTCLA